MKAGGSVGGRRNPWHTRVSAEPCSVQGCCRPWQESWVLSPFCPDNTVAIWNKSQPMLFMLVVVVPETTSLQKVPKYISC